MIKKYFYTVLFLLIHTISFSQNSPSTVNNERVRLGIDILLESNLEKLYDKRIMVLTNFAGRTSQGELTIDALINKIAAISSDENFDIKKLDILSITGVLTPEHGFYTTVPAGKEVKDEFYSIKTIPGSESKIGNQTISLSFEIPIHSLYGKNRKPSKEILDNCDLILVDLQDIGIRSYTYISTLYNVMQAAAKNDKEVIILDRPNPLGGIIIDGGTVENGMESFVGIAPVSYIHGCTIGELATMFNEEGWLSPNEELGMRNEEFEVDSLLLSGNNNSTQNSKPVPAKAGIQNSKFKKCRLEVIKMQSWERWMQWEDTGLMWFPTSPHIPTIDAIRGMAMLGAIGELGLISIGIGTTLPFQYIGFPGMNNENENYDPNELGFNGVILVPSEFQPFYGKFSGEKCNGFLLKFTPDNLYQPYTTGIQLLISLWRMYPNLFYQKKISDSIKMFMKVTGSNGLYDSIFAMKNKDEIIKLANKGLNEFIKLRAKYLMY